MSDEVEIVLSLRAAGLGDLLTAVPALRAVRAARPTARHVLATSPGLHEVAQMTGAVDVVVPTRLDLRDRPLLGTVDLAVNLHGSGPESHRVVLACRPTHVVAFARPELGIDGPQWDPDEHEVARWCRLVAEAGMPARDDDLDVTVPPGRLPPGLRDATVLHPGAAWPARRWPLDRWVALARAEVGEGRRTVVTVGPGEWTLGRAIAAHVPGVTVVDCTDDVGLLFRVVAAARVLVVGDTGVAHVATAVGTPSVVLFGPEPPSRWGPPVARTWHVALWAGRIGDPHGRTVDAGLLELGVVDVLRAARRLGDDVRSKGTQVACAS